MSHASTSSSYASKTLYPDIADRLAPRHTALVVVDMQNDFCAPGGYIEGIGRDVTNQAAILPPLTALIASARETGVPVVWLTACYEEELLPPSMVAQKRRMGVKAICCARGSWGADFFGVRPVSGEAVFEKYNYTGFSNPAFETHLRERGIETLLFSGVQTNICVEATLRDAHSRGFYVAAAADAVASHTLPLHEATLANVRFLLGDVLTSTDATTIWTKATAASK
ncbi:MAG TPA: cysteine hydrolase family protein [Magnetospirillaceae bacterium]|jgi:ureidoacrylate peracid hydrolase